MMIVCLPKLLDLNTHRVVQVEFIYLKLWEIDDMDICDNLMDVAYYDLM